MTASVQICKMSVYTAYCNTYCDIGQWYCNKLQYAFYIPVEDGTLYVITCGGRAASTILCPEHISKTMLAMVMKFDG